MNTQNNQQPRQPNIRSPQQYQTLPQHRTHYPKRNSQEQFQQRKNIGPTSLNSNSHGKQKHPDNYQNNFEISSGHEKKKSKVVKALLAAFVVIIAIFVIALLASGKQSTMTKDKTLDSDKQIVNDISDENLSLVIESDKSVSIDLEEKFYRNEELNLSQYKSIQTPKAMQLEEVLREKSIFEGIGKLNEGKYHTVIEFDNAYLTLIYSREAGVNFRQVSVEMKPNLSSADSLIPYLLNSIDYSGDATDFVKEFNEKARDGHFSEIISDIDVDFILPINNPDHMTIILTIEVPNE